MKKRVLTALICLFPLLCGAQDLGRWSIEAVGAMGLKYGPQFSAGGSCPMICSQAASVIPYLKLNAGIQLLPLLTRPAAGSTGPHLVGATLEPQVGIRFGRGFYAAIGLWLQQVSYRLQKNGDAPITNMLLETTGQSALTPSLSVHFGIRL